MTMYGASIKKHRKQKGYTQELMAHQLGISQNAYSKIESDQTKMKSEVLDKIATILELEATDLLKNTDKTYHVEQTNNDNSKGVGVSLNENAFDKERELYEKLLEEKDARIALLSQENQELRVQLKSSNKLSAKND